jgi:hypothetical protein
MNAPDGNSAPSQLVTVVSRLMTPWEHRHLHAVAGVRLALGGFTLGVGAVLLSLGRKAETSQERRKCYGWAAFLMADGAVQLSGGYLDMAVARSAPAEPGPGLPARA